MPEFVSAAPVFLSRVFQCVASEILLGHVSKTGDEGERLRFQITHLLCFGYHYRQGVMVTGSMEILQSSTFQNTLNDKATMKFIVNLIDIHIPEDAWSQLFG